MKVMRMLFAALFTSHTTLQVQILILANNEQVTDKMDKSITRVSLALSKAENLYAEQRLPIGIFTTSLLGKLIH